MVPRSKVYSFVPFAERQSGAELFCYPLNKKKTEKERISMQAMIDELAKQAEESLGQVSSKETLATFWQEYLSKNGKIPALMKNLRSVAPEERPAMGKIINELKTKVQADYDAAAAKVKEAELAARNAAETVDLTLPAKTRAVGGLHPLTLVTNQIIDVFSGMGFAVADAPEIEDDDHNFTRLNVPKDHPARDMQDTFYLSDEFLLRTQTSGGQIRTMDSQKPPIKVLIPGRVFRSDSDATHSPMFHQMEGLVVDKGITLGDLQGALNTCVQKLFGADTRTRLRPSYFPFTEPSVEVDVSCFECHGKGCPCASTPAGSKSWAAASSTARFWRTATSTRMSTPALPLASASSASPC